MPKKYTIRDGFSFVCADNEVKTGGAVIELDDDVAANHLHKLELVVESAPDAQKTTANANKNAADTGKNATDTPSDTADRA